MENTKGLISLGNYIDVMAGLWVDGQENSSRTEKLADRMNTLDSHSLLNQSSNIATSKGKERGEVNTDRIGYRKFLNLSPCPLVLNDSWLFCV